MRQFLQDKLISIQGIASPELKNDSSFDVSVKENVLLLNYGNTFEYNLVELNKYLNAITKKMLLYYLLLTEIACLQHLQ